MNDSKILFGCPSFPGTDVEVWKKPLSYLKHFHTAPAEMRTKALPELAVEVDYLPKEQLDKEKICKQLPSLIRGYVNMGASFGDGVVIDRRLSTTDVCVILNIDMFPAQYNRYFFK